MKTNEIFNIEEGTQQIKEVDPRNFDSDEDYYAALKAPAKRHSAPSDYPYSQEDDDAYFREIWRKNREAKAKQDKDQGVAEDNAEYDDEAGMVDNNLATLERAIEGIDEIVHPGSNLPEWCQEKIAQAKGMLVNVWDYMKSEEETGAMAEDWQKANRKDKTDGLSQKAVNAYRRENPGSKLQTAVTTKPSKLKAGSKDANRRKSFCARMSGMKGPMKDEHGKPTAKAKALSRWNCEEGAVPDYEAMFESQLTEMGAGSIAVALPTPSAGAGTLFGGSYSQKNSPFKKTTKKRTGKMIKR